MSRRRAIRHSVEFPVVLHPMRVLKLALAVVVGAIAVWFQAVLRVPAIKRRKAARRRARVLPKS
jgi:hypothetical protein